MMHENKSNKQAIFILSEIRSGSTWLSYVLGSHRNIAHLGEYHRPFDIPGHVSCRLCEAQGKHDCDILAGIENVAKADAMDFAFEKFDEEILVDGSKRLSWVENFIENRNFTKKCVHLHRDPRAWFASQKRRDSTLEVQAGLLQWITTNEKIKSTIKKWQLATVCIFYDEICVSPNMRLKDLVENFIGVSFERHSLKYWEYEHHGLGGNGAAFQNLRDYANANVTTGDDEYYASKFHKHFYDVRWTDQLTQSEINAIEACEKVNRYLEEQGYSFETLNKIIDDYMNTGIS
jgi:hypothetical protein